MVITVYDMIYERYPDLFPSSNDDKFRRQKRSCVLAADKVVCISETTRKDVQNYYGIDGVKLQVIPLAYKQDFRRLETGHCSQKVPNNRPFLLYVGRRDFHKNFKTLLQAYYVWHGGTKLICWLLGRTGRTRREDRLQIMGVGNKFIYCLVLTIISWLAYIMTRRLSFTLRYLRDSVYHYWKQWLVAVRLLPPAFPQLWKWPENIHFISNPQM